MGNPIAKKGFTLVELAIVLVIVGLLVGLGSSMVSPLMNAVKIRESKENLGAAVESLNSWASGNNRIPPLNLTPPDTATFANTVRTPNDSWGRPFIYLYDSTLAPTGANVPTKDTICGRRSTFITLTDSNTGAVIPNVAYILLSQADDAATDTKIGVTAVTSGPLSAITAVSADTVNDIVRWATLDELRTKVGCQGAPMRIVNNELMSGTASSPYSATLIADGGYKFTAPDSYSWCIQTTDGLAPAGLTFQKPDNSGSPVVIPSVANLFQTSCSTPVAPWPKAGWLIISGTPASGSNFFVLNAGDNNGNSASKAFVLTVNP